MKRQLNRIVFSINQSSRRIEGVQYSHCVGLSPPFKWIVWLWGMPVAVIASNDVGGYELMSMDQAVIDKHRDDHTDDPENKTDFPTLTRRAKGVN